MTGPVATAVLIAGSGGFILGYLVGWLMGWWRRGQVQAMACRDERLGTVLARVDVAREVAAHCPDCHGQGCPTCLG